MIINSHLKQPKEISSLKDIINYWMKGNNNDNLLKNFFISILPIISILLYISLGYFNPRYQKNHSTAYAMIFLISYIVIMQKLSKTEDLNTMIYLPIIWVLISIVIYILRIKKYF